MGVRQSGQPGLRWYGVFCAGDAPLLADGVMGMDTLEGRGVQATICGMKASSCKTPSLTTVLSAAASPTRKTIVKCSCLSHLVVIRTLGGGDWAEG